MLEIHLDSPTPLTDQLVLGIRRSIAIGEINVDDPLPSVRQLANDLGINLNTVARAYRALEEQGLVVSRRGRGSHVAADRATPRPTKRHARRDLVTRIGAALADARLAGLEVDDVRDLVEKEVGLFWKGSAS